LLSGLGTFKPDNRGYHRIGSRSRSGNSADWLTVTELAGAWKPVSRDTHVKRRTLRRGRTGELQEGGVGA